MVSGVVAFAVNPDPSYPLDVATSASAELHVHILTVQATVPVQYPRYKMYAPVALPTTAGWVVGSVAW